MAEDRRCSATRVHKPHLWSRTTRKTVTEETAGDTFRCAGSEQAEAPAKKGEIRPARLAEIRESVAAGRGKSMFADPTPEMNRMHGAMCRCGVHRKPSGLARHVIDDGKCTVHPDGVPEPYVRGAGE